MLHSNLRLLYVDLLKTKQFERNPSATVDCRFTDVNLLIPLAHQRGDWFRETERSFQWTSTFGYRLFPMVVPRGEAPAPHQDSEHEGERGGARATGGSGQRARANPERVVAGRPCWRA